MWVHFHLKWLLFLNYNLPLWHLSVLEEILKHESLKNENGNKWTILFPHLIIFTIWHCIIGIQDNKWTFLFTIRFDNEISSFLWYQSNYLLYLGNHLNSFHFSDIFLFLNKGFMNLILYSVLLSLSFEQDPSYFGFLQFHLHNKFISLFWFRAYPRRNLQLYL